MLTPNGIQFSGIVHNCTKSHDLYIRLREYDANVIDCGEKGTFVFAGALTDGEYNEMVEICKKFGDLEI